MIKKLAGKASGTASWCTNVGNEFGQVLVSVLTDSEGDGLDEMAEGLMLRYEQSHVAPPKVLYVDRDCCASRVRQQFNRFMDMVVRLDIWHFMRRFAVGCCSGSHAHYGTFMSQLSGCVFQWDPEDIEQLLNAKRTELSASGVRRAAKEDIAMHVSKKELATHCKRWTRGSEESAELIQQLIETFSSDVGKDTMGIPLLDAEHAWQIWDEQQKHLSCIQDPDGVELYTITGSKRKGGINLPVYRCARGSTSLESFTFTLLASFQVRNFIG